MKVAYFEAFQGRFDTTWSKEKVELMHLLLLLTLATDSKKGNYDADDTLDEMFDDESRTRKGYLFNEAVRYSSNKILNGLKTKGWFAGEVEEGSFAFALPGHEKQAREAVKKIELSYMDCDW